VVEYSGVDGRGILVIHDKYQAIWGPEERD
jgi:hypothetical protein